MTILKKITAVIAAIALSGCSGQRGIDTETLFFDQQAEHIAFEGTDTDHGIQAFTIVSDSGIATLEFPLNENQHDNYFRKYEKDNVVFEKRLSGEEVYSNIVFDTKNNCYYAYDQPGKKIARLDEKFDYLSDIADLDAYEVRGMDIVGDYLYVLSLGKNPYVLDNIKEEANGYIDFDEKAYKIDITTGKAEEINVKNPICQFYDGSSLYYYTCENGKYEVKRLDNDNASLLPVLEADDVGYIASFVLFEDKFIYSPRSHDNLCLKNLGSGSITSYANGSYCLFGTDMRLYKGNLVFINRNTMQVEKMYLGTEAADDSMKFAGETLVIHDIASYNTISLSDMKKATGISATIDDEMIRDEELMLKMMAGDSDIDIYVLGTAGIGRSVRKFGAYVPLNDCERINDFFSQCHDYISDYFTNENGDVWAVPVYAGTMAVFYSPQDIESLGLNYRDNFEMYSDFMDTLSWMTTQDKFDHYGYMEGIALFLADKYNVNYSYTDYNTDIFKTLLEKTRSGYERYTVSPFFKKPYLHNGKEFTADKTAFWIDDIDEYMEGKDPLNTWRVFPSPKVVSADDKNPVSLKFAVVNPYSKKIDAAKEFLSALAEDFPHMTTKFSPVYKDIEKYAEDYDIASPAFRDIFDISTNAEVHEMLGINDGMPFLSDYHDGKLTADEAAQEFERRAEIALGE